MQHWSCKPEASQPDLWWWSYSSGLLLRGWSWTACPQSSQNNKQHSFEPVLYLDQCSQLTKPLWFDTWLKRVEMVHASWHALGRRRKKCAGGQWFTKRSPQPSHVKKIATTAITGRFSINMWSWLRTSAIVASANYALSPKYHDTLYMTLHGQSQIKPVSKWRWQSVTYTLHLKIGTGLKTKTKQIQASSLNKETKGQALQASVQLTASNPYSADSKICPKSCNFWEPNCAHDGASDASKTSRLTAGSCVCTRQSWDGCCEPCSAELWSCAEHGSHSLCTSSAVWNAESLPERTAGRQRVWSYDDVKHLILSR